MWWWWEVMILRWWKLKKTIGRHVRLIRCAHKHKLSAALIHPRPRAPACPPPLPCCAPQVTFKWASTIPGVDLSDVTGSSVVFTPHDLQGHVEVGKVRVAVWSGGGG